MRLALFFVAAVIILSMLACGNGCGSKSPCIDNEATPIYIEVPEEGST